VFFLMCTWSRQTEGFTARMRGNFGAKSGDEGGWVLLWAIWTERRGKVDMGVDTRTPSYQGRVSIGSSSALGSLGGEDSLTETVLGRGAKEEAKRASAVAAYDFTEAFPGRISFPSKGLKVSPELLPWVLEFKGGEESQIIESTQGAMSTFKANHHHTQPAEDQVRGEQTIRVHLQRCPPEAPLSFLPVFHPQEQSSYHRAYGVLQIGDQMDREEGKGTTLTSTQKARNGDPLLPKGREQINAIAPVRGNGPIAVSLATQGTGSSDKGGEINPPRQKRFSVFPDTLKCVKEGKLYCSAALFSRGQVFGSDTYRPASLVRVVILPRSIPYLANLTTLISPVILPRKSPPLYPHYKGVNNREMSLFWL
jgi:hypothetical protein